MERVARREEKPALDEVKIQHPLDAIHDTACYILRIAHDPLVEEAANAIVAITRHELDVRGAELCRKVRKALRSAGS